MIRQSMHFLFINTVPGSMTMIYSWQKLINLLSMIYLYASRSLTYVSFVRNIIFLLLLMISVLFKYINDTSIDTLNGEISL